MVWLGIILAVIVVIILVKKFGGKCGCGCSPKK